MPLPVQAQEQFPTGAMVPGPIRPLPLPVPAQEQGQVAAARFGMPPAQGADERDILCGYHPMATAQHVRGGGVGPALHHSAEQSRAEMNSPVYPSTVCCDWPGQDFAGTLASEPTVVMRKPLC